MATNINIQSVIAHNVNVINFCNTQIEHLTHPEIYGCCLCKCNSIVINKDRMMTVATTQNHNTTYEFSPLRPTYFSPEAAKKIVNSDIFLDIYGKSIELEIIGKLEYYELLKEHAELNLKVLRSIPWEG